MPADRTQCIEISSLHCRVLEAKGLTVEQADFIKWAESTSNRFDKVVMNPPFSEGRAQAHVEAAAGLVKPGGRLVAILPAGIYSADGGFMWGDDDGCVDGRSCWKPSIHMPRWASRITLEITDVRVERLQDISRADAIAEGGPQSHPSIDAVSRDYGFPDFSRSWFGQTWWSIYGEDSWQANPWVWAIEFKRVEVQE